MQKFTVFSILLSLGVILVIGDVIYHDYLNGSSESATEELLPTPNTENIENVNVEDVDLPSTKPPETTTPTETVVPDNSVSLSEDNAVDNIASDVTTFLQPTLNIETFSDSGFLSPVLKDTSYSGLVFQFISFSDQTEATIYQSNLFDGEQYIGSIYEIRYPTETGSFQGYLALRERASALTDLGEVNEVSNYGDASFYFNHKTKIKTVHLVIRSGSIIYAFEYAQSYHEKMKKVFDILSSPL